MKSKDIEKQIIDILETDPVVKEYQEKKKNKELNYLDKVLFVKYISEKTTFLYSVFSKK